jgi:carbon storage regulator
MSMPLVLSRRPGETIRIGEDIFVSVVEVQGKKVRISIVAPAEIEIVRCEIDDREPPPVPARESS